ALKTNSTLITLTLYNNSIGDNGAQALAEALKTNSTLTTLELLDNLIAFDGTLALILACKIHMMPNILNGNDFIKTKTVLALFKAFKMSSTLTTLILNHHSITYNGSRLLSEALKTNSTLTTLNLDHNLIGDNGATALSAALKTNSTLTTLD
ncbi:hypothetical protein CPB97_006625, partial [Podila verticillata]